MVELTVHRVGLCTQDGSPVIVLREQDGDRYLSLKVSSVHANAVMRQSYRMPPLRPQTHEVFVAALQALGAHIVGAYLDAPPERELAGDINLMQNDRPLSVFASAADAVVLAIRSRAPIFISPSALERFADLQSSEEERALVPPGEGQAIPLAFDRDIFRQFIETLPAIDELGRIPGS